MKTEYLITLAIVVVGVILGGYLIGKFKLNSYEEYLEGNEDATAVDSRGEYLRVAA